MAFELYNPSTRANEPYIAIDRQGRLRLSSSLRDMLNCRDRSISLYLAYDPVNHRIAIAKPDIVRQVNVRPLKFDAARGYASGAGLIAKYRIPAQAHRYTYVGKEQGGEYNGWLVFQREHYEAPDDKLPE